MIDQQQQLQLTTLAENRQLKDHVKKLSDLLESSSLTQRRQAINKNDNLSNRENSSNIKDKNYKQDKNYVADIDEKQKKYIKIKPIRVGGIFGHKLQYQLSKFSD